MSSFSLALMSGGPCNPFPMCFKITIYAPVIYTAPCIGNFTYTSCPARPGEGGVGPGRGGWALGGVEQCGKKHGWGDQVHNVTLPH